MAYPVLHRRLLNELRILCLTLPSIPVTKPVSVEVRLLVGQVSKDSQIDLTQKGI